jgi:predicted metal-dependent peptidase
MPIKVLRKGLRPHKRFKTSIAIDVSGSVSDEDITELLSELSWLFKTADAIVELMYFDTTITKSGIVTSIEGLEEFRKAPGRGGTSYKEVLQHAIDEHSNELIIMTDGYGDQNELETPPTGMRVWWICTTAKTDFPFGEVFNIDK